MSSFVCGCCSTETQLFTATTGGAEKMAKDLGVPFLGASPTVPRHTVHTGRIPLDPRIGECMDKWSNFLVEHGESAAAKRYVEIARALVARCEETGGQQGSVDMQIRQK